MQGTLIRVFSTSNCAKIAELRRGLDFAIIFSVAISPSNTLLAVTSDKSTLHIFDLPHPRVPSGRSQSPSSTSEDSLNQKWGILGKIPLLPRMFSDVYSFASAHFEFSEDHPSGTPYLSSSLGRPSKGVIGWINNQTLLVIGAGKQARWEKFSMREEGGKRWCVREGWKRYLGVG